jgi:CBS-domain-containing membrane protein
MSAVAVAFCASFIGVFVISIPSLYADAPLSTRLFLIGSFGASAALLYAAPHAEFAQPRNIVFGQLIAAFVGVTAFKLFGGNVGIAGGLAVATATLLMQVTGCLHPPAGATALIAVLGPAAVHRLGYLFMITPVLLATLIILVLGLALLNLSSDEKRHYPVSWW